MRLLEVLAGSAAGAQPPRTAVVVAHPDDEVLGAGARLPRLRDALFVYVTDGAPVDGADAAKLGLDVDGYRNLRRRERAAALASCGIKPEQVVELGAADQQASLQLAPLARELAALFEAHRIEAVLTQPYEGGHPDHDATAFIVHAAARLARSTPRIVEMTSYHAMPGGVTRSVFLPNGEAHAPELVVRLTPAERAAKQALVDCHASQRDTLRGWPLDVERYRPAPAYDFSVAPHVGALWYDRHRWGMTGPRFRELAAQALAELGLAAAR